MRDASYTVYSVCMHGQLAECLGFCQNKQQCWQRCRWSLTALTCNGALSLIYMRELTARHIGTIGRKGVLDLRNLCIPMQCSRLHTFMEASMSTVPTRRSSVTPRGICTKGASMTFLGIAPFEELLICSLRPTCDKDMCCLVGFHRHASHEAVNTKTIVSLSVNPDKPSHAMNFLAYRLCKHVEHSLLCIVESVYAH